MGTSSQKKNFVFISYNHRDVKWAKWLQKKLEWYRLPTEIHNEFSDSRYIRPVFRDRDTLTSGVLNDELRAHLEASQFLVVLCSPNSARSEWVSDEVKAFIEMGRVDRIVPFIIDGSPQDYSNADIRQPLMGECFPLALRQWNTDHPDRNLLGIAVTDDGQTDKQKSFIRLVAYLLGLDFDTLWQRHKRYVRRMVTASIIAAIVALMLVYWFMIPVKLSVTLKDQPNTLPGMEQGVISFNGSEYTFTRPDTTIELSSLPGYYRLRELPLHFNASRFYTDEEVLLPITMGVTQDYTLQLHRDSTFAVFAGRVCDGDAEDFEALPLAGALVKIGNREARTDADGRFHIDFPLEEQKAAQSIVIEMEGFEAYNREDESPNASLMYLLHRGQ